MHALVEREAKLTALACDDRSRRAAPGASCAVGYKEAVDALAQRFGERRIVETFLAVHADPTEVGKKHANVVLAALHVFVSPLFGDIQQATACETASIATERPLFNDAPRACK